MSIKIHLTQDKFAIIDDEDLDKISGRKWRVSNGTRTLYALGHFKTTDGRWISQGMHRVIMGLKPGDKKEVDHINHNGLDNRKCNLRIVTKAQNQHNRQKQNNTSGFKGVRVDRRYKKQYQAVVRYKGRNISAGYYYTAEEAAKAYDKKALELFGKYAYTNFKGGNQ